MTAKMNWQNLLSTQRFRTKDGEIVPTVTPSTQEGADALRTGLWTAGSMMLFNALFNGMSGIGYSAAAFANGIGDSAGDALSGIGDAFGGDGGGFLDGLFGGDGDGGFLDGMFDGGIGDIFD